MLQLPPNSSLPAVLTWQDLYAGGTLTQTPNGGITLPKIPTNGAKSISIGGLCQVPAGGNGVFSLLVYGFDKDSFYNASSTNFFLSWPVYQVVLAGGTTYNFFATINAESEGYYNFSNSATPPIQEGTFPLRYGAVPCLQFGFFNDVSATKNLVITNFSVYLR